MKKQKRIALLISTIGASEREVLRGIGAYSQVARHWVLQLQQPGTENINRLTHYRPDGIIAAVWNRDWIEPLNSLGVPVVNIADVIQDSPFPAVIHDSVLVGEMAVQYFVDRGFERLGFIGLEPERFSHLRGDSFVRAAEAKGRSCSRLFLPAVGASPGYGWREQDADVLRWLGTLEPPVGILAANDGRAVQLLEASRQTALRVPEDLAVVGVDNDDLLCNLCRPPLSSVQLASNRLGYEAARLLDRLLNRNTVDKPLAIPPTGIVTRLSSDVLAVNDTDLLAALRYIREHAHRPLRADEVADQVAIARRSLERRFMLKLGHTILDEIHSAHVTLAKLLLSATDLPMQEVAAKSGFSSIRHLPIVFRKFTGQTPGSFRKQHRLRR